MMELVHDVPLNGGLEDTTSKDKVKIYVHALTKIKTVGTMHLSTVITGALLWVLVDYGSNHSISTHTACHLDHNLEP